MNIAIKVFIVEIDRIINNNITVSSSITDISISNTSFFSLTNIFQLLATLNPTRSLIRALLCLIYNVKYVLSKNEPFLVVICL